MQILHREMILRLTFVWDMYVSTSARFAVWSQFHRILHDYK